MYCGPRSLPAGTERASSIQGSISHVLARPAGNQILWKLLIPKPSMPSERKPFVNVDELMPQVSLDQAARYYGVLLPELHRVGNETRTACFLNCGKDKATGDRALAIQENHPAKQFHC